MNRQQAFLFLSRCLSPEAGQLREEIAAPASRKGIDWERVVAVASEYWMTLALHRELGEKRVLDLLPPGLLQYFDAVHELNRVRNQRILEQAGELAGLLNGIGVEPLLLKGACHLASGLYPDPAVRFMDDIDILVPGERAVDCWRLMISSGYRPASAFANVRVETTPEEWPELRRAGRIAVVEMHRAAEWGHMLSAPELYQDAAPLAIPGGQVRIPNATTRMIFALAHSYVHHRVVSLSVAPLLRDLYDATLLQRRLGAEIDWHRVADAFEHAGRMKALRAGCMMWKRLLSQTPGCEPGFAAGFAAGFAMDPPPWPRICWQSCMLNVRHPAMALFRESLVRNAALLRTAMSMTPAGKRSRREISQPTFAIRKLRTALRTFRWR